jgi:hypothetical protein
MKTLRNVKLSFYDTLETLFETASTFGTAMHVYREKDLHAETKLVDPYIFLLDHQVPFTTQLPVVAQNWRFSYRSIQLGGPALWHAELFLNCFGRNRGEREDIAAAIVEGIVDFAVYDYTSSTPAAWGTASQYENVMGEYWTVTYEAIGNEKDIVEGTLLNWASLESRFWILPS